MDDDFQVEQQVQGGTRHVLLSGELDGATAKLVERDLVGTARDRSVRRLVLHLGGLSYIDSSGMALLLRLDRLARRDGFTFAVARPTGSVRARLELTGLLTHLTVVEDDRPGVSPGR